jgi:hypothetical protein
MSLAKLYLAGIIKFFPARESLVSDIPAGDGKIIIPGMPLIRLFLARNTTVLGEFGQ